MRPAAGVDLLLFGESGLLFDARSQDIVSLNATGAVIWCLMMEQDDPAALADAFAAATRHAPELARAYVSQALADWSARGLLAGTVAPAVAIEPPPPPLPSYPDGVCFVAAAHYRFRDRAIRMRFTGLEQADIVSPLFSHLVASPGASDTDIDIACVDGAIVLYRDRAAYGACGDHGALAPLAKSLVWQVGLDAGGFLLNIHAGVVEGDGGCILLAAPPGHGKSTLTAALVGAGLGYFSDEVALLSGEDFVVSPFPLAICVKHTGVDVMATLFPAVRSLPFHARGDGKRVAYLPPPREALRSAARPVVAIIFPRHVAGAALCCTDIAKADALARLLGQCLGVGPALDLAAVRRLLDWLTRVPCVEMSYGSLADAVPAAVALDPACDRRILR